jgi:hypothetical protein
MNSTGISRPRPAIPVEIDWLHALHCTPCQERRGSELKWSPRLTFKVVLPLSADAGRGSVPTRTAIGNYLWSFLFEATSDTAPRSTMDRGFGAEQHRW